jgi:predicted amidohydrolase
MDFGLILVKTGFSESKKCRFSENLIAFSAAAEKAAKVNAALLVMPRMHICGEIENSLIHQKNFTDTCEEYLLKAAHLTKKTKITAITGCFLRIEDRVEEVSAYLCGGKVIGVHTKNATAGEIVLGSFAVPYGNLLLKNIFQPDVSTAVASADVLTGEAEFPLYANTVVISDFGGLPLPHTAETIRVLSRLHKCAVIHPSGIIAENGELLAEYTAAPTLAAIDTQYLNFSRSQRQQTMHDAQRTIITAPLYSCRNFLPAPERLPLVPRSPNTLKPLLAELQKLDFPSPDCDYTKLASGENPPSASPYAGIPHTVLLALSRLCDKITAPAPEDFLITFDFLIDAVYLRGDSPKKALARARAAFPEIPAAELKKTLTHFIRHYYAAPENSAPPKISYGLPRKTFSKDPSFDIQYLL